MICFWQVAVIALAGMGLARAANFSSNFATDPGVVLGTAVVEEGVLKLTTANVNQKGSWSLPDLDNGAKIGSFTASFKALIGGGSARPAQGFSFVFAPDIPTDAAFGEGGGPIQGLVISFDTADNNAGFGAEGNEAGTAPGIIVKIGGATTVFRKFDGLKTDARYANVLVQLDADGTLDVTYDGVKVYDNVAIPYIPSAGSFGFGAATSDLTAALNANHFIDDLTITTTPVTGAYVSASSPAPRGAGPAAVVRFQIEGAAGTPTLKFDNADVAATVTTSGGATIVTYDPPGLLASGSTHSARLTYAGGKTFALDFQVISYPTIGTSASVPASTVNTSASGFKVRVYQVVSPPPASIANAESILAGRSGANIADTSTFAADGTVNRDVVNFDQEAAGVGVFSGDELIPGIPGTTPDGNSTTDNIAAEIIGYLDLPAGLHTLGVNSDDGFRILIGSDPRDVTSLRLGNFEGVSNSRFTFAVEQAGIYPVRLVWYEAGGGAHVELYSLNAAGEPILVNDRASAGHIKAYRERSSAFKAAPYISRASPAPDASSVTTRPKIEVSITDDQTTLNASSIQLKINGVQVQPAIAKQDKVTSLTYQLANDLSAQAPQLIDLSYGDNAGNNVARQWRFTTGKLASGADSAVKGYWRFLNGDLKATIGNDLELIDPSLAGNHIFGVTGQGMLADVPGIGGKPTKVLTIPYTQRDENIFQRLGLKMKHGIAPNGGGQNVNQWTLIMDVYWGDGTGNGTVLRTHDFDKPFDGDLFWAAGDEAYGKGCCSAYAGADKSGGKSQPRHTWARAVFSVDLAASPRVFAKYINGFKHREDITGDGNALDSRFSLPPEVWLFNDGDDNEQSTVHIAGIQIRAGRLSDEEVAALAGPSADGIPVPAGGGGPVSPVKGQWDFDNGTLQATIGNDLALIDPSLAANHIFGTTGQGALADVPGIGGKAAKVLSIPYTTRDENIFQRLGLKMKHGIAPNGGGKNVNQWTLIMDVYWGDGTGNGTVLRTHDFDKPFDGDLFWAAGDEAYGKGCCSAYAGADKSGGKSQPRHTWARAVFSVDLAANPRVFAKYINGYKHREDITGDGNALDSRFSLPPEVWLFNDGDDNEQSTVHINSIQIREGRMTDEEVLALGGPSADPIPQPAVSGSSPVKGYWTFNDGSLKATVGRDLALIDPSLSANHIFATTGQGVLADVPGIGGTPVKVLAIPYTTRDENIFQRLGLKMNHGIAPNGGGKNVNQWTLIMDVYWGDGTGNGTVLRTHDFDKAFDGDLFWAAGDEAYGKGCCSAYAGADKSGGKSQPRHTWARAVFSVDLAASPRVFAKYINGFKHREDITGDGNALDSRFSLPPEVWLFNDGDDNEQSTVYVDSLQIREGRMTDEEVAALGGPSPAGIPVGSSEPPPPPAPRLGVAFSGGNLVISWPAGATGYVLEVADSLTNPNWTPVTGVANNSATVAINAATKFYRLRK